MKYKGQKIDLHEGDIISIVGYLNLPSLVGNFDITAYRLRKFSDEIQTYAVEDDDFIAEISDDDEHDGTSFNFVKMDVDTSLSFVDVTASTKTSETPQPLPLIDVQSTAEIHPSESPQASLFVDENVLAATSETSQSVLLIGVPKSNENPSSDAVLESTLIDVNPTPQPATSNWFRGFSPLNRKCDDEDEFDLVNHILDGSTAFEDLDGIKV